MANRTVTVFKSHRRGALFGTGAIRSFTWTYVPGSGAEDQNVTGVTFDGKYLIFCTDEPNPALGTSARFVVVHPRTGQVVRNFDCGVISDGGLRDICWDGKYIWGLDYYANDGVPTCAISKYSRRTGGLIRRLVTGLSTAHWALTFDGKYLIVFRNAAPQVYGDVYHPRTGSLITSKIMLNVLDPNVSTVRVGAAWDGKYILTKSCPQFFAAVPMNYKAHHRRAPDSGAGVCADVLSNGTVAPRAGEASTMTFDGKYLYDFSQA